MALVPYRVSGAAADQRAAERLLQLPGGITLRLTQWPGLSGATAPSPTPPPVPDQPAAPAASSTAPSPLSLSGLSNVGLVVWQAGYLLAEYLLRMGPFGRPPEAWRSLTVVDLGAGSGVVGLALALAGCRTFLTDLQHVLPLTAANAAANCDPNRHRVVVCPYVWGEDPAAAPAASQPCTTGVVVTSSSASLAGVELDVITAADVLYHTDLLEPLMAAIVRLSAPHTVSYVSYRVRHGGEVAAFLRLAEAAGFAAEAVPDGDVHEEYRSGSTGTGAAGSGGGSGRGGSANAAVRDILMQGDGDDDDDDEMAGNERAVIQGMEELERGSAVGRAPGPYGILRLCRRDCSSGYVTAAAVGVARAVAEVKHP